MSLLLLNRDPEPNETSVPVDTEIFLELVSANADIDETQTQIYVDGVLAFDGGTFQTGYNDVNSTWSKPFFGTMRVNIDPTSMFDSEQSIQIHVLSQDTGGGLLDKTYTFTIEDITPPRVVSAMALGVKTIRVEFNEAMKNVSAEDADDALNPSNYMFARLGTTLISGTSISVPQVNVEAVSVEKYSETEFDITTDIELSFGTQYLLTATGIEDANGNPISIVLNVAEFTAYYPPQPALRRFDLRRMLPRKNFREDATGDLERMVAVFKDVISVLLYEIDQWTNILDPDIAEERFVDAILADLGNPFSFSLSLEDKRRLIRVLVRIYKSKGTAAGIEAVVLFFLGLIIEVRDCNYNAWTLGEDELGDTTILGGGGSLIYSFEIVSGITLSDEEKDLITKLANYMKPAHTHLKQFVEPAAPVGSLDHWELGLSELGDTTILH